VKQKACYVKRENKKHCQELVELVMKEKGKGGLRWGRIYEMGRY